MQGKIVKGIAGFYYVHAHDEAGEAEIYECKAKGVFRKDKRKPLVGDDVELEASGKYQKPASEEKRADSSGSGKFGPGTGDFCHCKAEA